MQSSITKNDICCAIITFNPDRGLLELIDVIESQVNRIIIIDNFSDEDKIGIVTNCAKYERIEIIKNCNNLGIAKALNQGVEFAKQKGFNWVITFDQDTKPFNNIIDIISKVYYLYPDKNKIGAIGANAVDAKSNIYYCLPENSLFSTRDYLITSGCLISVRVFSEIGGFREDLFIDNVDIEYSLRLSRYGKVSLITEKPGMMHKAGNSISKKIFGFNIESSHHNSIRRYYMARNHVILTKKYFSYFPYFIFKLNFFFILSVLKIILFENNKKDKIRFSLKGICEGLSYPAKKYN
jgi:rhamnosyltransferase